MNFSHSLLFLGVYYFKFYSGILQRRWLYVDGGGLAIMAAGHDPCRRRLLIFPGGSNFILRALHFIFSCLFFPPFFFSFSLSFLRKRFPILQQQPSDKTKYMVHQRCRFVPSVLKIKGKAEFFHFLPLFLVCLAEMRSNNPVLWVIEQATCPSRSIPAVETESTVSEAI